MKGIRHNGKGFTLIEVIVVLIVLSVLAGLITPFVLRQLKATRAEGTKQELNRLKEAIIGDPTKKSEGVRTDFGYLGDLGKMPGAANGTLTGVDKLKELIIRGNQDSHKFFPEIKIGAGWQGPYITAGTTGGSLTEDTTLDAYGTPYTFKIFDPEGLNPDVPVASIISPGDNGLTPDNDDIGVDVLKKESFATVRGLVATDTSGRPLPNVPVTIFFPDGKVKPDNDNGIIVTKTTLTDGNGSYYFDDIPFGIRSLTVEPKITLASKSATTKGNGSDLEFFITNFSYSVVEIKSVEVFYNVIPPAFYEQMKIGHVEVFKAKDHIQRKGTSESVSIFPSIEVAGRGKTFTPIVVYVDSPDTRVKDILIGENIFIEEDDDWEHDWEKKGAYLKVEIKHFRDSREKEGKPVDVTGVEFTVVFNLRDGSQSVVTFVPERREEHDDDDD